MCRSLREDLLYGDDEGKQLEETWQIPHQYDTLAAWSAEQWTAFLRKCVSRSSA